MLLDTTHKTFITSLTAFLLFLYSFAATAAFNYQVYEGDFNLLPDFDKLTPIDSGTSDTVTLTVSGQTETFALRFTNLITVNTAGTYTFQLSSDDGSRLLINGNTIIDHDGLHAATAKEGQAVLSPGTYNLTVEYFEKGGGEALNFLYKSEGGAFRPVPSDGVLIDTILDPTQQFSYQLYDGEFSQLPDFSTLTPVETGTNDAITIGFVEDNDTFAMVFTKPVAVSASGNYTFKVSSDDGSRLYINDVLVVDHDGLHGFEAKEGTIFLAAGSYDLRVEYFEQFGGQGLFVEYKTEGSVFSEVPASGVLTASSLDPNAGGNGNTDTGLFTYQVFDGDFDRLPDFNGLSAIDTGTTHQISLADIQETETFAALFEGQIEVTTAGNYTFQLTSDDGSKLLINNTVVIDHDGLHGNEAKSGEITLVPGTYDLRVEYFEKSGGQSLALAYQSEGGVLSDIPADGVLTSTALESTGGNSGSTSQFDYEVYQGEFNQLPDFSTLTPDATGTSPTITLDVANDHDTFALVFTKQIAVATAGNYSFRVTSDDGSKLLVNNTVVVDHDGLHSSEPKEGQIFLNPGTYDLRVEYFEKDGGQALAVAYKSEGSVYAQIPADGVLTDANLTPNEGGGGNTSLGSYAYQVFDGEFSQLPDFSTLSPVATGTTNAISLDVVDDDDTFAALFEGQIEVTKAGSYAFQISSDDGSKLLINNTVVVDHDGLHGNSAKSGEIFLIPGIYDLQVEYFEKTGGQALQVSYKAEGGIFSPIPADGVLVETAIERTESTEFNYQVYEGDFNLLPDFSRLTPVATGISDKITLDVVEPTDYYAVVFSNHIYVSVEGTYEFRLLSNEGSKLYIDDSVIINNDGIHAAKAETAELFLTPGSYDFRVEFFEGIGRQALQVEYRVSGGQYAPIPVSGQLNGIKPGLKVLGEWGPVIQWPHIAISAANLPDGRVLTWSSTETNDFAGGSEFTHSAVYNPIDGSFVTTDNGFHDMFCSGVTTLEDGSIVASGGNPWDRRTSKFDPTTLSWTPLADMFDERWYATNIALPNNEIFASFGQQAENRSEKYDPVTDQWVRTPNANLQTLLNEHNAQNNGGDSQWLAHLAMQPDGKVFHGGPGPSFSIFDPVGGDSEQNLGQLANDRFRMWGNAVSYDAGKVLLIGGSDQKREPRTVDSNVYEVDLNGPTPVVTPGTPMNIARSLSNSITLPNGEIIVVGGNQDGATFSDDTAVFPTEIYNTENKAWRVVDSVDVPRTYHSTLTLLKDARVLSAGGGACGNCSVNHLDAQIYSPPYLFNADDSPALRPTLSNVPAESHAGATLNVNASNDIQRFTMIRLAAHTHHINTDHRFVSVDAVANGNGQYTLTLTANPNVLIQGYYWLFAINANGTPSVGQTIQIKRVDSSQIDSDGDGVPDALDAFPTDPNETQDTDGDGIGDNADPTPNGAVTLPALSAQPQRSSTLIVENSAGSDRIWNVNPDNNTVSVTGGDGVKLAEITVGSRPWSLAKAPNQAAVYVTNKGDATVSVIDANTLAVTQTIGLPHASQPHGLVFDNQGVNYFVVLEALAKVQKYEVATGALVAETQLTGTPRHLAITYDDSALLVSNFITPPAPGESTASVDVNNAFAQVFTLNPATMAAGNTIQISHDGRQPTESQGPGLPNYLGAPVISYDNLTAYVPSKKDNISAGGTIRDTAEITFDQTVRAQTSIVYLTDGTEGTKIDLDNASMVTGGVLTADDRYLIVALETSRELAVIDTTSSTEQVRLQTGLAPQSVAISSDGQTVYAHNFMDRSISAFDISAALALTPVVTPSFTTPVVANEQLTSQILLGKQLFYDATDDRLARDNYMSCASCHNDGGHDGRVWDMSGLGEGLRNTIDLRGRAGMGHGFLHWTANFDEVQDFEVQIRLLAGGLGLMDNTDLNVGTRTEPLGDVKTGLSANLDALAAYVGTLNTFAPSPYTNANGSLTAAGQAGRQVFIDHNCASCHGGENFSLSSDATGLSDVGTLKSTSGTRLFGLINGLDIPTLRDVWSSAPYLHDGSAQTLQDAVNAHSSSVVNMTPQEVDQVVQYLLQIGDGPAAE